MRFEPPTKCRQRLSRRHILRQVVPDLWADNQRSSPADQNLWGTRPLTVRNFGLRPSVLRNACQKLRISIRYLFIWCEFTVRFTNICFKFAVSLGDVGHYDNDGHMIISDRMKELIKVKGHQVRFRVSRLLCPLPPSDDTNSIFTFIFCST